MFTCLSENDYMDTLQDFDLILFGGTGDLAMRKLLPALYRRFVAGMFPPTARVVGVARRERTREAYQADVEQSCREHAQAAFDDAKWREFAAHLHYLAVDASQPESFAALEGFLRGREPVTRIFFLSLAPTLFAGTCDAIGAAGLRSEEHTSELQSRENLVCRL